MTDSEYLLHADADAVAEAIASRLVSRIVELQRQQPTRNIQLGLTGGRIATRAYQRLAQDADAGVDWSRVELWWGDERFVPADSEDRNDHGALAALRPALPLPEANLHPIPADDGRLSLDAAAERYANEFGDTVLDICLLGVGPDGHVASVFPHHPSLPASLSATGDVIAVRDSPKPPPLRVSLTHRAINRSTEVWFTVAGADKAAAVAGVAAGDAELSATQVHGIDRTIWFLDRAAATQLPT